MLKAVGGVTASGTCKAACASGELRAANGANGCVSGEYCCTTTAPCQILPSYNGYCKTQTDCTPAEQWIASKNAAGVVQATGCEDYPSTIKCCAAVPTTTTAPATVATTKTTVATTAATVSTVAQTAPPTPSPTPAPVSS